MINFLISNLHVTDRLYAIWAFCCTVTLVNELHDFFNMRYLCINQTEISLSHYSSFSIIRYKCTKKISMRILWTIIFITLSLHTILPRRLFLSEYPQTLIKLSHDQSTNHSFFLAINAEICTLILIVLNNLIFYFYNGHITHRWKFW